MEIKKKLLLISVFAFLCNANSAFAIEPVPLSGVVNTHDINSYKEFEREKEMQSDFEKFQKYEENQPKEEIKKKREKSQIEAKVEEYATKGVFIKNIEVSPSKILTEDEIKTIVNQYNNDNLTLKDMNEIVNKINDLYIKKGFVTARAYLPPQTIKNKTIKIILVEGKVGNIKIEGNKWTKTKYIQDRIELNNVKTGNIFNISALENNLVNFNKYNYGVNLKGTLSRGQEKEGTTDIVLNTEEKSPFHVSAIFDNGGRDSTGNYRGGLILQDDSLFGFRDRLTIGSYASRYSITPFADYNIPVNKKDGRVGFMFSYGNSKVGYGPYAPFNIKSRSYTYSLYYNQPLIRKPYMELTSTTSLNYKQAAMLFDGNELNKNKIAYAQTGLNFRYDTQRGIWYLYQNIGYAFPIFDKESNYININGGLTRLHDFGHGVVGQLRGNYQVIPKHVVPSIDQFQLGGMNTVRGYSEGLIIGRTGYFVSGELSCPIAPRTILSRDKTKQIPFIGSFVKGFAFIDQGAVFPYKGSGTGSESIDSSDVLLSVGVGLKVTLPGDFTAKLSWGFPCIRNRYQGSTWGRFHFELCLAPDFDKLVKLRKPKQKIEQI